MYHTMGNFDEFDELVWINVLETLSDAKQFVKVYFVKAVEVGIRQSFLLYGTWHI